MVQTCLALQTKSPAPQLQTINVFVAASAGLRKIGLGDLEEALLQGKRVKRLLFVEQPKGGTPDLQHGQLLLRLEAVVYGTLRGSVH